MIAPGADVEEGAAPAAAAAGRFRLSRAWTFAAAGLVVLLAGIGGLGYIALTNHDRADRWRERSLVLQDLLVDRTTALNRQTARLNEASVTLRQARTAIARSEEDVADLERRQRALANEKAQVEDQRAVLLSAAGQLSACNTGLRSLVDIVAEGYSADPGEVDGLAAVCAAADRSVSAFTAAYAAP
jgi:hypothetical protein